LRPLSAVCQDPGVKWPCDRLSPQPNARCRHAYAAIGCLDSRSRRVRLRIEAAGRSTPSAAGCFAVRARAGRRRADAALSCAAGPAKLST
jgi:hypothetical protein